MRIATQRLKACLREGDQVARLGGDEFAILLMGLPMFRMDRQLWLVTVMTTILLLGAMGIAMRKGVG